MRRCKSNEPWIEELPIRGLIAFFVPQYANTLMYKNEYSVTLAATTRLPRHRISSPAKILTVWKRASKVSAGIQGPWLEGFASVVTGFAYFASVATPTTTTTTTRTLSPRREDIANRLHYTTFLGRRGGRYALALFEGHSRLLAASASFTAFAGPPASQHLKHTIKAFYYLSMDHIGLPLTSTVL